MPCESDIILQGFSRCSGKLVDVPLVGILPQAQTGTSGCEAGNDNVSYLSGDIVNNLGPGTYILGSSGTETFTMGIGTGFLPCGGELHASVSLSREYFELTNNTGKIVSYDIAVISPNGIENVSGTIGSENIVSFPASTMNYVGVSLYIAVSDGSSTLAITGTIIIIPENLRNNILSGESLVITDDSYPTINLTEDPAYVIDNSNMTSSTYLTIEGVPSKTIGISATVYTKGPLYIINSIGIPLRLGLSIDGMFYKGISNGGVLPGFPIGRSISMIATFSPYFDNTGNLNSVVGNIQVTTATTVTPFDGKTRAIEVGSDIMIGDTNNTYILSTTDDNPVTLTFDQSLVDANHVAIATYFDGTYPGVTAVNKTGVPLMIYSYGDLHSSSYILLAPGASAVLTGVISGAMIMNIIPGGQAGISVYYMFRSGETPPSNVYIGSNSDNTFTPVTYSDSVQNIIINGTDRISTRIPVSVSSPYTVLYVGNNSRPYITNFSSNPITVQYDMDTTAVLDPSTSRSLPIDTSLVGSITVIPGSIVSVYESSIPVIILGEEDGSVYDTSFDKTTGVYSPDLYDLLIPTSIDTDMRDITIVLPQLTNIQPLIVTILNNNDNNISILNSSGYTLSVTSYSSTQKKSDSNLVNRDDIWRLSPSYETIIYIPSYTSSDQDTINVVSYNNI